MKKANLIDMFGLSGDPSDEDRLEKLLHLASDELDTPAAGCSAACFVIHDHNNCLRARAREYCLLFYWDDVLKLILKLYILSIVRKKREI